MTWAVWKGLARRAAGVDRSVERAAVGSTGIVRGVVGAEITRVATRRAVSVWGWPSTSHWAEHADTPSTGAPSTGVVRRARRRNDTDL